MTLFTGRRVKYHVHHHPRERTKKMEGVKAPGVRGSRRVRPSINTFHRLPFSYGNGPVERTKRRETDRAVDGIKIKGTIEKSARSP